MNFLSLEYGFLGNMALGVSLNMKDANREGAFGHELVDDLAPNEDTARLMGYSFLRVI
jgi:hypothetical protein